MDQSQDNSKDQIKSHQNQKKSHNIKTKPNGDINNKISNNVISNKSEERETEDLVADTSGVTDIEMMLESHQDMLQFIHIMAQVSEINIS